MYWIAISMTVVANVTYNLCSKMMAPVHPLAALSTTYGVALLSCLILYPLLAKEPNFLHEIKQTNWASPILGLAIVALEAGFILAFRSGWSLSYAALFSNTAVAIILLPIAAFFFKDNLSLVNGIGVLLAISGLILMTR